VDCGEELYRLVHDALELNGSLIPVSPDAVARAETVLENERPQIPSSLATFEQALDRAKQYRHVNCAPLKLTANMEENLARAAREGKDIAADIEAKMRADRAAAEGNANGESQK
jgi:hypothetical protein